MTFLPIVGRELRTAARRRGTHRVRLWAGLLAIIVGGVILVLADFLTGAIAVGTPRQIGLVIFDSVAGLALAYCLFSGRFATADCLSLEKREGTLGLLFLTDLKGYDVVLGKLVATSLGAFYGLLAIVPVLAVPLLMGGVARGEYWRVALVLVNTFLFSLAIGIFVSALCRDLRQALAANFLLLLLFVGVLPITSALILYFRPAPGFTHELFYACPIYSFVLASDTLYKTYKVEFWASVAVTHALTWAMVALASWIAPHSWKDQALGPRARRRSWREVWRDWTYGTGAIRAAHRRRCLNLNPFLWLASRSLLKRAQVWIFLGLMGVWWIWGWIASGSTVWFDASVPIVAALILNTSFKWWVMVEAGQQLWEDQRAGAFELLLSTPLGVPDIIHGQILALRQQFFRPLLCVLAMEFIFMVCLEHSDRYWNVGIPLLWLAGMVMLVADLAAAAVASMWSALVARTPSHAMMSVIARILVLPWAGCLLAMLARTLWATFVTGEDWTPTARFTLGWWFGLGMAADLYFGITAWRRLHTRFRDVVVERFSPAPARPPWWRRLSSAMAGSNSAPRRRRRRIVLAAASTAIVLAGAVLWSSLNPARHDPPPVMVSLARSNGPVRVAIVPNAALFILPDGSLWCWGEDSGMSGGFSAKPERVGTNYDWTDISLERGRRAGIRADGTLWEWGSSSPRHEYYPEQVGSGRDWMNVSENLLGMAALRQDGTLWTTENSATNRIVSRTRSRHSNGDVTVVPATNRIGSQTRSDNVTSLVQIGTNQDWVAVGGQWRERLALRKDGTLWVWGPVPTYGAGMANTYNLPLPTQACQETNWERFVPGFRIQLRDSSGKLWRPFSSMPGPTASASEISMLLLTNARPDSVASAYCGSGQLFEVRSDGTLWAETDPSPFTGSLPTGDWHRVGKRSDWVAIWGGGTAFGLTADGTLWVWGRDLSVVTPPDFAARLQMFRSRINGSMGMVPGSRISGNTPYQKEPRPLLKMLPPSPGHGEHH